MAAGDVTVAPTTRSLQLLAAATATNSVPSGATAGFPLSDLILGASPQKGLIFVDSTAGSGTMTVTLKVWGYLGAAAVWVPYGASATAASRGLLNLTNAIDEQQADKLRHSETIDAPWCFDRVYLEITAIGGTSTAVSAWLVVPAVS